MKDSTAEKQLSYCHVSTPAHNATFVAENAFGNWESETLGHCGEGSTKEQ